MKSQLLRSVVWNVLGAGVPVIVAIILIPRVIEIGGTQRFGLLGIIWVLIGYFSLFDLGLGRALTRSISERVARGESESLAGLVRAALLMMTLLGLLVSLLIVLFAPFLVRNVLSVPDSMTAEAIESVRIMAFALPFVVISTAFVGILEAHLRFGHINLVRMPLGIMTFVAPYIAFLIAADLRLATTLLALLRILSCLIFAFQASQCVSGLFRESGIDRNAIKPLLSFGGWLTVSNLVGPLMVYFDRLFIGSLIGLTAVSYYVTPYEVVTRLWILPIAVVDVLFPALTAAYTVSEERLVRLFRSAIIGIALIMLIPVGAIYLFAEELLQLWLDDQFDPSSVAVAQWLVLGVFINSVCRVPLVLLLGTGKPDWVAKLHLAELLPYVFCLIWLVSAMGIEGAAIAWSLRIAVDTLLLFTLVGWSVAKLRRLVILGMVLAFSIPVALLATGAFAVVGISVVLAALLGSIVLTWTLVKFRRSGSDTTEAPHGGNTTVSLHEARQSQDKGSVCK